MSLWLVMVVASEIAMAVCLAVGVGRWSRVPAPFRLFVIQAGLGLVAEVSGLIVGRMKINNHFIFNAYVLLEFFTILFAASAFIPRHFRKIAVPTVLIFGALYAYDLATHGIYLVANHAFAGGWLTLGFIYFLALIQDLQKRPDPEIKARNLIGAGLVGFYFVSLAQFSLLPYMISFFTRKQVDALMIASTVFSLSRYILATLGIWTLTRLVSPPVTAGLSTRPAMDREHL